MVSGRSSPLRPPPGGGTARELLASEARFEVARPSLGVGDGRVRGWGPAGQPEAIEDRQSHVGRLDRSEQPHPSAAAWAVEHVDSEDPPREAPPGIKEKLELYNRLQVEDPERAQALLSEFMSDEAVVASLANPVEFDAAQIAFVEDAIAKNPDARWTFLFLHEPAWENPADSFKAIQTILKERKHTFFAGHLHYYDHDLIDGNEHITMRPAGASFHQDGPGNVDHITWVTMTDDGSQIANIALKGVFDRKGLDPELFGAYDRKGH